MKELVENSIVLTGVVEPGTLVINRRENYSMVTFRLRFHSYKKVCSENGIERKRVFASVEVGSFVNNEEMPYYQMLLGLPELQLTVSGYLKAENYLNPDGSIRENVKYVFTNIDKACSSSGRSVYKTRKVEVA